MAFDLHLERRKVDPERNLHIPMRLPARCLHATGGLKRGKVAQMRSQVWLEYSRYRCRCLHLCHHTKLTEKRVIAKNFSLLSDWEPIVSHEKPPSYVVQPQPNQKLERRYTAMSGPWKSSGEQARLCAVPSEFQKQSFFGLLANRS